MAFSLESGLWRGIHTHPVDDWQLFGTLCEPENGGKTIMGRLTVMGKPISPQRYLGEWRRTLENPATPETLLRRGLIPYGHCTRPTHPLKSPWHPGQSFETAYENCQAPEGYRFDLSQTHAAQAFYDITEWSPTGPERGSHLYPVSWTSLERTGFDVREASRRSGS